VNSDALSRGDGFLYHQAGEGSMSTMSRRQALAATGAALTGSAFAPQRVPGRVVQEGRLKQSVSRWCYASIPLPELCTVLRDMGLTAVDLLEESEWEIARDHGLVCSMAYGGAGTITDGLNLRSNHDTIVENLKQSLPKAARFGLPNVITFFGNRRGISDAEAISACVAALNRVKGLAEDHGVTLCVELLNSKVDHPDYQGDRTWFGREVVQSVGSPRVKLLYDIYHMQIMEGDIIRTIRENHEWIAHYHTGGVPGRHELDDSQELNWRAVARAIADSGFEGFLAHEFVPTRDPLTSLAEAVALCDV
jgi:hydroxypyruvate isomerase